MILGLRSMVGSNVASSVLSGWASMRACFWEKSVWYILLSNFGIKRVRLTTCGEVGYETLTEWITGE